MTPKTVLYVEDSDVDEFFVKRVFETMDVPGQLCVVHSGESAMDYLNGSGLFADREKYPLPVMMMLDLKLPGLQGFDVLAWIREQPQFKTLPVIIFTSSDLDVDRGRAQRLGADGFLVKPADMSRLYQMLLPVIARYLRNDDGKKAAA